MLEGEFLGFPQALDEIADGATLVDKMANVIGISYRAAEERLKQPLYVGFRDPIVERTGSINH